MDEKPFSLAEIILGTICAFIVDCIAAVASAFSIGILGAFVHAFAWLAFTLWFTMKGAKATASLVKRYLLPIAVQSIPFLPTATASFLLTTYVENNPEKFGLLEMVSTIAKV